MIGFLLVLAGLAAGFVPVLLGWPDLPGAVPLSLTAVGTVVSIITWARKAGKLRVTFVALDLLLLSAFWSWYLLLSRYGPAKGAPDVGTLAPEIHATRVRDGEPFSLRSHRGRDVVLIFYRGPW